jgi:HAMP domain-containing protein
VVVSLDSIVVLTLVVLAFLGFALAFYLEWKLERRERAQQAVLDSDPYGPRPMRFRHRDHLDHVDRARVADTTGRTDHRR